MFIQRRLKAVIRRRRLEHLRQESVTVLCKKRSAIPGGENLRGFNEAVGEDAQHKFSLLVGFECRRDDDVLPRRNTEATGHLQPLTTVSGGRQTSRRLMKAALRMVDLLDWKKLFDRGPVTPLA